MRRDITHALQELGVEGRHEAPRFDAVKAGQLRDPARHRAVRHAGNALDLDDVSQRRPIAVKDLLELRDAVLPHLRRDYELLDLPPGEGFDRDPLGPQDDLVVVEDDGFALTREPDVELDRLGAEALGEVEALDRVLARPAGRAAVPHDPGPVLLLPVAHRGGILSRRRPRPPPGSPRGPRPDRGRL